MNGLQLNSNVCNIFCWSVDIISCMCNANMCKYLLFNISSITSTWIFFTGRFFFSICIRLSHVWHFYYEILINYFLRSKNWSIGSKLTSYVNPCKNFLLISMTGIKMYLWNSINVFALWGMDVEGNKYFNLYNNHMNAHFHFFIYLQVYPCSLHNWSAAMICYVYVPTNI